MKLSRLLDGPSRFTTKVSDVNEFTRVHPRVVERDLRVVTVRVRAFTSERRFLFPWRKPISISAWEVEAILQPNRHERYVSKKVLMQDFDNAVQTMVLDVQKKAVNSRLAVLEARLKEMQVM